MLMITRLLLALTALVVFVTPAAAQDMPPLIYDFSWTVDSMYSPKTWSATSVHLTGDGLLSFSAHRRTSPLVRRRLIEGVV